MTPPPEAPWTIDGLGAQVALALSVDYDGPPNGRVRDVPDPRTIRYYTTLGLLDRPAEMRGRTALYGRRHLLQLVAIKRLQGRGLSLAEIQQELVGATDASLARLARLPAGEKEAPSRRADAFWATTPSALSEGEGGDGDSQALEDKVADGPLQGVTLGEDVILLLRAFRLIEDVDIPAIRVAAEPLLKLLQKRRLLRPRKEGETP